MAISSIKELFYDKAGAKRTEISHGITKFEVLQCLELQTTILLERILELKKLYILTEGSGAILCDRCPRIVSFSALPTH